MNQSAKLLRVSPSANNKHKNFETPWFVCWFGSLYCVKLSTQYWHSSNQRKTTQVPRTTKFTLLLLIQKLLDNTSLHSCDSLNETISKDSSLVIKLNTLNFFCGEKQLFATITFSHWSPYSGKICIFLFCNQWAFPEKQCNAVSNP